MAICGYAVRPGEKSLDPHECERMCQILGRRTEPTQSCAISRAGLHAIPTSLPSGVWSDSALLIAYGGNFYERPAAYGDNIGSWIAALYHAEGYRFLERLRGTFALALWDQRGERLLLAVDRLGAKTLYYALTPFGIIFASQPSAIFASGRLQKTVNLSAVTDYLLYNVVPRPKSAFRGVTRLRPGECVQWDEKGPTAQLYWEMQYPEDATASVANLSHQLLAQMEDSVRITSQSLDLGKAGCFLSGGTDSSSILGL